MSGLPKITLVTPSFNQARFLPATLASVLDQKYPHLEYLVLDGGSSDGSPAILKSLASQLAFTISQKDGGQYDAINQGFRRGTGEILGWLNSDDQHLPWTLRTVGEIFRDFPAVDWISSLYPMALNEEGHPVACRHCSSFSGTGFLRGENLPGGTWPAGEFIQQESTFWRRSLWDRIGGNIDPAFPLAGDFDLWARFFASGARLTGVSLPLGAFRFQKNQKTSLQFDAYFQEAKKSLLLRGGRLPSGPDLFRLRKLDHARQWFGRRYQRALRGADRPNILRHDGRQGWTLGS